MRIPATTKNYCSVCGAAPKIWIEKRVINDKLASDWSLSPSLRKKIDLRESSICPNCGNSRRTRVLAQSILKTSPTNQMNLIGWISYANKRNLKVAEINGCGQLHQYLKGLKHLSYSEYVPAENLKTRVKNLLKGISNQDICNLSYKNNQFDLVIHSDVLEHVPDYQKAISECKRILKPTGICLFTTPIIMRRRTKDRKNMSPSFHGSGESDNYVFWEFGQDILKKNKIRIFFSEPKFENYVFAVTK